MIFTTFNYVENKEAQCVPLNQDSEPSSVTFENIQSFAPVIC